MIKPLRLYPVLLMSIGLGSLSFAWGAEYGFGLEPCILCLYQRIPFAVVAILGGIGFYRPQWMAGLFTLATLAFAINAAIAFYHVGVEQHWWVSAAGCGGGNINTVLSTTDLLANLEKPQPKPCDAVDWTLFGISMASWNVVFSGGLAVISGYVLKTRKWEE